MKRYRRTKHTHEPTLSVASKTPPTSDMWINLKALRPFPQETIRWLSSRVVFEASLSLSLYEQIAACSTDVVVFNLPLPPQDHTGTLFHIVAA